jgi:hypothetical protein
MNGLILAILLGGLHSLQAQTGFEKVGTIDLADYFGPDKALGTNPVAIDYDGQRIYLAGYNAGDKQHAVRMLILSNLDGELEAQSSAIPLVGPPNAGCTDVLYLPETDSVYLSWYDESFFSVVGRFDPVTGETIDEFGGGQSSGLLTYPGNLPFPVLSLARDPGFAAGAPGPAFPALSIVGSGSVERMLLDPATGQLLDEEEYGITVALGDTLEMRDHVYDPETGDIWVREGNGVTYTTRTGDQSAEMSASGEGGFADFFTAGPDIFRRMALVPASAGLDTQPWILLNDRSGGDAIPTDPTISILRADGSTEGLVQTVLDGSEGGNPAWTIDSGPLAPAVFVDDVSGSVELAVLAGGELRIDLYRWAVEQGEPRPVQITSIAPGAGGGLLISWADTLPGPYLIEAGPSASGPFTLLATGIEANEYLLEETTEAFQFFRVFTVGGSTGPVEPPVITQISPVAEGIEIVWTPSDVGVYTIQRAEAAAGPFTTIASNLPADRYTDTEAPDTQAFYRVIRTDSDGPIAKDPIPVQITGITVSPSGNPVLHWDATDGATYRIARSESLEGPYDSLTDEAEGGSWEDQTAENQHGYYKIWLLP